MQSLERRIATLEQSNPDNGFPKVVIVSFPSPGEPARELYKLRDSVAVDGYTEWAREANESEQEFKERAIKEASRNGGGIAVLFKCE